MIMLALCWVRFGQTGQFDYDACVFVDITHILHVGVTLFVPNLCIIMNRVRIHWYDPISLRFSEVLNTVFSRIHPHYK